MNSVKKIKFEKLTPKNRQNQTQRNWHNNNNIKNDSLVEDYFSINTFRQKDFSRPKPIREYRRFPETKKACSGIDVEGSVREFINKDTIRPISKPYLYENFNIKNPKYKHIDLIKTKKNNNEKWAIHTTKRAPNYETLPIVQQFKKYYFPPKYNNKDPQKYKEYILKSDHIGLKGPKLKKVDINNSFLKLKRDYSVSSETKQDFMWVPYPSKNSAKTSSSKNYDIINFMAIAPNTSMCQIMNKTLYYRKKGVGEYGDLSRTFRVNNNKDFLEKFQENPKREGFENFVFSKRSKKAAILLNESELRCLFKIEKTPRDDIILIYRIYFQMIDEKIKEELK